MIKYGKLLIVLGFQLENNDSNNIVTEKSN